MLSGYWYAGLNCGTRKISWVRKHVIDEDSEGVVIPRNRIHRMSLYQKENDEKLVFGS